MAIDTNINELVINKLTKAQYQEAQNAGSIVDTEIYMVTDDDCYYTAVEVDAKLEELDTIIATDENSDGNIVLRQYNPEEDFIQVDNTLSIEGAAADAKATGEALAGKASIGYGYSEKLQVVEGSTDEEFLSNIEALCAEKTNFATFQAILYPSGEAFDGNSFVAQIFHNIDSSGKKFIKIIAHGVTSPCVFQRVCYSSVWSEPEWENPPMELGVTYRTTERHNGKPVYARRIQFVSQAANSGYFSPQEWPVYKNVIRFEGKIYNQTLEYWFQIPSKDVTIAIQPEGYCLQTPTFDMRSHVCDITMYWTWG